MSCLLNFFAYNFLFYLKESDYVCGFDGVAYKNKCLAEGAGTGVDYYGPCLPMQYANSESM